MNWTSAPERARGRVCGVCWRGDCHRCTSDQCLCAAEGHPFPLTCPEIIGEPTPRRCNLPVRRQVEQWSTAGAVRVAGEVRVVWRCGRHARMHELRARAAADRRERAAARARRALIASRGGVLARALAEQLNLAAADRWDVVLDARPDGADRISIDAAAVRCLLTALATQDSRC